MEELEKESKPVRKLSVRRLLVFLIPYGFCILFSVIGVVLGAINFAAGPAPYSGFVLVLWLLMDLASFVGIALHLAYYGIEIWRNDEHNGYLWVTMYTLFIGGVVTWAGIALLVGRHFGWFSACALALLVACGVIDAVMMSVESNR